MFLEQQISILEEFLKDHVLGFCHFGLVSFMGFVTEP